MITVCANCQEERREIIQMGDYHPDAPPCMSHGICQEHYEKVIDEIKQA